MPRLASPRLASPAFKTAELFSLTMGVFRRSAGRGRPAPPARDLSPDLGRSGAFCEGLGAAACGRDSRVLKERGCEVDRAAADKGLGSGHH
jgi:hypothetical protein